ncbi:PAS domain S-box protein [Daejeonella oryzae]|uniref:PAS domain S-box protein n=1 Tax=Daejeonella oryzae TaxID=1122943 RepID=UPI00040E3D55|nr:PAS domain S-box protein [Daejeonella oryzae]
MKFSAQKPIPEFLAGGGEYIPSEKKSNILSTDKTPVALCIYKGSNYIVEYANRHYLQLLQKDENIIGKPFFESFTDLESQGIKEISDQVIQSGISYHADERELQILRNEQMEQGFFNFVYQPYQEQNGIISGIIAVITEVTDMVLARKKIEESYAFNKTVLESSPDCMKLIDTGGRLHYMNANGLCIMEIDDFTPYINKFWWELWGVDNEQTVKESIEKALKNEPSQFQAFCVTAKGTPKWWDVKVSPVMDITIPGKVTSIISVSRDITFQKIEADKLAESEHRYQEMVKSSPSMIAILRGEEMFINVANEAILETWGKGNDVIGKSLLTVMPELVEQGFDDILKQVYFTGQPYYGYEVPVYIVRGSEKELFHYTFIYQAQRDSTNIIEGVSIIATEVSKHVEYNKKIKDKEELFQSLADQVPMFVFNIEPNEEATISYWNKTWLDYTGQTIQEALGSAWEGIIHPDDVAGMMEVYREAFKNRQSYLLPSIRVKRYDGEYRWHMVKANPRYLPNGEFSGFVGVGFDVHDQKLAELALKESESHFRLMADLMPAKISNAKSDGSVLYFNKSWMDFTGMSFEEIKELGYHKIMHPDEVEEFSKRFQKAAETGSNLEMEMRFLNKHGEYIWHLNLASPVKDEDGTIRMWVGVTSEIQKLKDEEKQKEDFMKMVSHELKTPVTSIKGYVQFLLSMLKEEQEAKLAPLPIKSSLKRVEVQVVRLTKLINEILDLSRLKENKLNLDNQIFNLNDLVVETVQDILHTSTTHTLDIKHEYTGAIYGDKDRIGQVLINIINNAIKYSPVNEKIEVKVHNGDHSQISVSIKDSGIGITETDRLKIFDRFYRVEGENENVFSGFGIGLFITKEIIERHHGLISIESDYGKGSTFTFSLPLYEKHLSESISN